MSRKAWFVLAFIAGGVVLLGVLGAAGAFAYLTYRDTANLKKADDAFAAKKWSEARFYYAWYLARHSEDLEVLPKYVQTNLHLLGNRRMALRNAGTAYFQIAKAKKGDPESVSTLLRFWQKHAFWTDLEYCSDFFLRQKSAVPGLPFWKALALDRQGRSQDAIDNYSVLVENNTDELDAYGNLARLQYTAGFVKQAEVTLATLRERFPDQARTHLQFVRYYMLSNRPAEARIEIDKALEKAPNEVDILLSASQIALRERRWADAVELADRAIAGDPAQGDGYILLLTAFEKEGSIDKALDRFLKLSDLMMADNPDLFLVLAELQIGKELFDDAHATIDRYRRSYPEHGMIFDYLEAREMLVKGSPKEAASKLAAVTKSIPDFGPAQYYLAAAYLQSDQADLAKAALELYLQTHQEDDRARLLWNSTFGAPQTNKEALAGAKSLLADEATSPESYIMAAEALMRQGTPTDEDLSLARELVGRVIQRQPGESMGYLALMELAINTADAGLASDTLARAEKGGVPADQMELLRAGAALAAKDLAAAYACYQKDLGRADIDAAAILRWARFLARRDSAATALRALTEGLAKVPEDRRFELESERVTLCITYGDMDEAQRLLDEAAANATPETLKRLSPLRMRVAEVLLRSPKAEEREKANALMEAVAQTDPETTDVRTMRAQFYLDQEPPDFAAAEALGAAALEKDAKDVRALLLMAEVTARKGQYSRSLSYARQAAALEPQNKRTAMALTQSLMQMQRYREAVQTVEGIVSARPDDTEGLEMLVRAYAADKQGPQAEATLDRLATALGSDPSKTARIEGLRGWLQLYQGRYGDAERFLRAQIQANPNDAGAQQGLASALAGQGRAQEASEVLRRYAEQHGASPEAWTALARFYLTQNDPTAYMRASSALTRALLAVPDYAPALRGQIEVQARSGNVGAALGLCDRYLQTQPDDADVLFQRALILAQDRHGYARALESMDRAILQDERSNFLLFRGTLQVDMGRFREALADLQKVAGAQGVTPGDLDTVISEAHAGLKEYDVAKLYFDSARQKAAKGERVNADRLARVEKVLREQGLLKS